jgi:hypothetical protein
MDGWWLRLQPQKVATLTRPLENAPSAAIGYLEQPIRYFHIQLLLPSYLNLEYRCSRIFRTRSVSLPLPIRIISLGS